MVSLGLLVGCNTTPQNIPQRYENENVKIARHTFEKINNNASFVLKAGENGEIVVDKDFSDKEETNQFEWYTDAFCGDCIRTHTNTKTVLEQEISNGLLEVRFHPVNFLPHKTSNDYSLAVASFLSGLAEKGTTKELLDTMNYIYDKSVRDTFKDLEDIDEVYYKLEKDLTEKELVSEDTITKIFRDIEYFEKAVNKDSVGLRKNEFLMSLSPKEDNSFFVPFIYNAKTNTPALLGEEEDTQTHVTNALIGYVGCNTDCE